MNNDNIERLVKQAKEDPQFFHDLVFDPEKTISKIDFLNGGAKGNLFAITPEDAIKRIISGKDKNTSLKCQYTCGGSCRYTGTCQWTCRYTRSAMPL